MEKFMHFKRKRSENWSEEDKMLLKDLVRQRVKILENKNTDTNTNLLKKKAWMDLEKSFNNLCSGHKRNVNQLKYQWIATKAAAKRQNADRQENPNTSCASQSPEFPENSNDIAVWLNNEVVGDNYNEFDSDGLHKESEEIQIKDEPVTVTEEEFKSDEEIEPKSISTTKKKTSKKRSATEANVNKLTEFEIKCRRELHQLQIEAESKRIRNLDREYDLIETKIKYYERNLLGKTPTNTKNSVATTTRKPKNKSLKNQIVKI